MHGTLRECYDGYVRGVKRGRKSTLLIEATSLKWFEKLSPEVATLPVRAITAANFLEFKSGWQKTGLRLTTGNLYLRHIRAIMNSLAHDEIIDRVPRFRFFHEEEPTVRVASRDEVYRLAKACDAAKWPLPNAGQYWRSLILTAITTGLRMGDLLRLTASSIDRHRKAVVCRQQKTQKLIAIPASESLLEMFSVRLDTMEPDEPLFHSTTSRRQFYREWKGINQRAGITPPLSFHDLRRTCGSWAYELAGLNAASELLSHSSVAVTRRHYVHQVAVSESLRPAVQAIGDGCAIFLNLH